jgi:ABC transporter related
LKNIISIKNLTRIYNIKEGLLKQEKKVVNAVNDVSFEVKKGEIFGLLGPNGAGKTTIIKVMTTLLAPSSGEVKILGYDSFGEERYIRPRINFIFGGERSLYWRLSAKDNLQFFCDQYLVPKSKQSQIIDTLLDRVGLLEEKNRKVENFSKGMKQRLQIARSLINDPEIIFLDEPSIGLDPVGSRDLKKIVRQLSDSGKTVVLTTHYMPEADELCDRIAIIDKGKLVEVESTKNLKEKYSAIYGKDLSLEEIYIKIVEGDEND